MGQNTLTPLPLPRNTFMVTALKPINTSCSSLSSKSCRRYVQMQVMEMMHILRYSNPETFDRGVRQSPSNRANGATDSERGDCKSMPPRMKNSYTSAVPMGT